MLHRPLPFRALMRQGLDPGFQGRSRCLLKVIVRSELVIKATNETSARLIPDKSARCVAFNRLKQSIIKFEVMDKAIFTDEVKLIFLPGKPADCLTSLLSLISNIIFIMQN